MDTDLFSEVYIYKLERGSCVDPFVRVMFGLLSTAALTALALSLADAKLTWADTKYMIVFGDSYTTNGYNISAGIDSPVPGFTSSNGPNWVGFLGEFVACCNALHQRLTHHRVDVQCNGHEDFQSRVRGRNDRLNSGRTVSAYSPVSTHDM